MFQFVNQLETMTDCFRKDFGAPTAVKSAWKTQNEGLVQANEVFSPFRQRSGNVNDGTESKKWPKRRVLSILWALRGASERGVSNHAKRTVLVTFCDKNTFQKQLRKERQCWLLQYQSMHCTRSSVAEGMVCDDWSLRHIHIVMTQEAENKAGSGAGP